MSLAIAKGLYGIGVKGPQDRRRRQMEDEQFERQGEKHELAMEQGELGIQSTKQDMEIRGDQAERDEWKFEQTQDEHARLELARQTQKEVMESMLKFEASQGQDVQPLISVYSNRIRPVEGYTETTTPDGKRAVMITHEDGSVAVTPIHSYMDEKGQFHKGITDLAIGVTKEDPAVLAEAQKKLEEQRIEAQQAQTEHEQDMQARLASRVPGERVQADEEGNLSVAPGPAPGAAGTIFEIGKLNVKDIDPAVVAKAQRHLNETGDYPAAVAMLSEGVQTREDKAFLERLASIPDMVREMLPTEGLRNPIDQFVRRYPNEAEKYGVSDEDTYGTAFRKIEEGLAQEMGGGESRPTLGIGGDRGGQSPGQGGDRPDGRTPETAIKYENLPDDKPPADGTHVLRDGKVYSWNAETNQFVRVQ